MGTPLAKPGPTIGRIVEGAGGGAATTGAAMTTGADAAVGALDTSGVDGATVASEGAGLAREPDARGRMPGAASPDGGAEGATPG